MKVKASERQADVAAAISRLDDSGDRFREYAMVYQTYRAAVKTGKPVSDLLELSEEFKSAKSRCREAFDAAQTALKEFSTKYDGDAMALVSTACSDVIATWDQSKTRAKYAAEWMGAFAAKFRLLAEFGNNLNGSRPRQSQIKKVAAAPWPEIKAVS